MKYKSFIVAVETWQQPPVSRVGDSDLPGVVDKAHIVDKLS